MALVSFQDVSVTFGGLPLLDRVHLQVEKGQRVCLLGRNGEGEAPENYLTGRLAEVIGIIIFLTSANFVCIERL